MANMSFTNNAATTLLSSITSVATSLTVASGTGVLFPALSGSQYFWCTLANNSGTVEIVKVTARSTDTFTITRAQDNTSAVAWNAGDKVELRLVAAALNDLAKLDEANTFTGANAYGTPASLVLTNATGTPSSLGLANATGLSLTTGVTGTLPTANGGTNSTATPTAGGAGYGTGTAHAYTAAGTTGQVLTSQGSSAPVWAAAPGLTAPSTGGVILSGSAIDFTGIPSTCKRITINFVNVTSTVNCFISIQVGNGSIVTTGYVGTSLKIDSTSTLGSSTTSGMYFYNSTSTYSKSGQVVLVNIVGTNNWTMSLIGATVDPSPPLAALSSSTISLTSALDRVRFGLTSSASFAGSGYANIIYES